MQTLVRIYCLAMRTLAALIATFILAAQSLPTGQGQAKPVYKQVKMFLIQADQQIELAREVATVSREQDQVGGVNLPSEYVAHLSGGNAKNRLKVGDSLQVLAQLPPDFTPKMIELFHFTSYGGERIVVMQDVRDPTHRHINTLSFRAGLRNDGQWVLTPLQLKPGEYCFSPRLGNDNFCFGIDAK
jgi:hypothetical protein